MRRLQIIALVIVSLTSLSSSAQTRAPFVRGIVQDSLSRSPLEEATVSLMGMPRGRVLQSVRSSKYGFAFRPLKLGDYMVVSSYLGYTPDSVAFTVHEHDSMVIPIRLRMQRSSTPLMEVVVRATIPPAIVRSDTIAFNAGAFPTRPYATVEDLLRKLPGMDVDRNGNVTMQGKKIDKIYLDGKEFFLGDVKTATQNLPADIVTQVETYNTQTEKGRLTGIQDNTGGKTINIKLKKDRKKGYFGKAYVGAGNNESYSTGGTATNLGNDRWIFGALSVNNINNQFTGKENNYGSGGGGVASNGMFNLNYKESWGKKITAILNGGYNASSTTLRSTTGLQTFLTDSSLLENRLSQSNSHNKAWHLDGHIEYNIDSFNTLSVRSSWSPTSGNNQSMDTVGITTQKAANVPPYSYVSSLGKTVNSTSSNGYNINNSVDFRSRFRKRGRSLYLNFTESLQRMDQPGSLYSLVNNFDSAGSPWQHILQDQHYGQTTKGDGYGAGIQYTEPLSPHRILDFSYHINTNTSQSDKESFQYDSTTAKYDRPDSLTTNHFFNRNTVQRIGLGYNATEGPFRYQIGLATQLTSLLNNNYSLNSQLLQHFMNWYPRANLIWSIAKEKNLQLGYTGSSTAPTISQLQPLPDLTNPFLVKLGNPDLQQQFTHSVDVAYNSFNGHSLQNWQVSFTGDYIQHEIVSSTMALAGGVQQLQYINVEGVHHFSSSATYGFPLGKRKGNANISAHAQYGHDISMINGQQNITNSFGSGGKLNVNYRPLEKLYIDGNASLDLSSSKYSVDATFNTRTLLQNYFMDVSYEFPFAVTLTSNYSLQITGSQGALPTRQTTIWNASIYKSIFRSRAGQLRFSAFDILNNAKSVSQSVGSNYIMTSQTNLPGRLWLLSFVYHFRKFPGRKPGAEG